MMISREVRQPCRWQDAAATRACRDYYVDIADALRAARSPGSMRAQNMRDHELHARTRIRACAYAFALRAALTCGDDALRYVYPRR